VGPGLRAAIAAVIFIALLLALAPARLLGFLLPPGQAALSGYSGTLWRGSASRALVATPAGWFHLGRVHWQLRPWSLLLFAPRLAIDSAWGSQLARGDVIVRSGGAVGLRDFELSIDAALLQQLAPVALEGTLRADIERLEISGGEPREALGRAVWQGAAWQAPAGLKLLGDYAMEMEQPAGEPLLGTVLTLAGPVTAAGTVALDGRRYNIDLDIGSEGAMDPGLQQALSLVAQPVSTGYKLRLDGAF
jgi:hypothetical protein